MFMHKIGNLMKMEGDPSISAASLKYNFCAQFNNKFSITNK